MTVGFFQTVMGRRFIEGTMPEVAKALTRIANVLEKADAIVKNDRDDARAWKEAQACIITATDYAERGFLEAALHSLVEAAAAYGAAVGEGVPADTIAFRVEAMRFATDSLARRLRRMIGDG
jgi:hypothetical protein